MTENLKIGVSPIQQYTPANPHNITMNKLYDGRKITGIENAIKDGMKDIINRLQGPEGQEMKARVQALKKQLKQSWKDGASRQVMLSFGEYF